MISWRPSTRSWPWRFHGKHRERQGALHAVSRCPFNPAVVSMRGASFDCAVRCFSEAERGEYSAPSVACILFVAPRVNGICVLQSCWCTSLRYRQCANTAGTTIGFLPAAVQKELLSGTHADPRIFSGCPKRYEDPQRPPSKLFTSFLMYPLLQFQMRTLSLPSIVLGPPHRVVLFRAIILM